MKKILFALLLMTGFTARAQVYNNEWIDYSKTYYKFKVGKTGLYRISQATLVNAGLAAAAAEDFQLWRNGQQVPIYTSTATGVLSGSDYIEFWGEMNDGKADKQLFRHPSYQLNDKWSLSTDSATYFLTIASNTSNKRLTTTANNVAGTTLSPEPYFMYTAGKYFRDKVNGGYAVNVGSYLYSSSYDKGEGWSSVDISTTARSTGTTYGSNSFTFSNLFVYAGGPQPSFKIAVSGNAINPRRYKVTINADSVLSKQVDYFNYAVDSTNFGLGTILSNQAAVTVTNVASVDCYPLPTGCLTDRMVIHQYELTYPRQFNFGGATNFEFTLPAAAEGKYLQITNFSSGASVPVLYDLTNGLRYVADVSGTTLGFVLNPSVDLRKLVLVSEANSNVNSVGSLQERKFVNYSSSDHVGDYLIISHPYLYNGPNGTNPVEDYKAYRSSDVGGSYVAQIYESDELVDQFGFGIKKFPGAIRNFIRFARNTYSVKPKQVFLIGKGVNYIDQQRNESSANATTRQNLDRLNLVPTFGNPASDILLSAEPGSSQPLTPIGRLSAISAQEVSDYLSKVKEYELAQATLSPNVEDKDWMKNVVHIVGASDDELGTTLSNAMNRFKNIISDTLFGAKVSTFSKNSADAVEQLDNNDLVNLFNHGISLITYFGHSSSTTLEFNLDNPENYTNQGKYPLFIGLGCNAGNFFGFSANRFMTKETISEKYVLAPNRGTIGFVASTHFGIVHYLDIWNTRAYKEMSYYSYGKSVGEIMKKTAEDVFASQSQEDFYARANVEQTEFHGDPAIKMNTQPKADYVIEDQMVKVSPGFISVADASFNIDGKYLNLGKAPQATIVIEVKRRFPNQTEAIVFRDTVAAAKYSSTFSVKIPIDPIHDKGLNKLTITVDADGAVDEMFETNNSITKEFMIYEDEARPVYPYNFAIINKSKDTLVASTADPFSPSKEYRMELDTTELFNSPAKIVKSVTSAGGVLKFDPGISFTDGTVYYWRVAPVPESGPFSWNTASFIYLTNSEVGFNQSHLYQHLKSEGKHILLDSFSREWKFREISTDLFIRNGVFPTAASQAVDFSVSINGDPYIRSVCGVSNIIVNVIDPKTFKPWFNAHAGETGQYGSDVVCGEDRAYNFQFNILDVNKRKKAMEFLDLIPDNYFVVVRNTSGTSISSNTYASDWKKDTLFFGSGNSLYHRLYDQGFKTIDSFNRPRSWIFVYQMNQEEFAPKSVFSVDEYDKITLSTAAEITDSTGYLSSPLLGPAKKWGEFKWKGSSLETPSADEAFVYLLGARIDGQVDTLFTHISQSEFVTNLETIDVLKYPWIKLVMVATDKSKNSPYQLDYWRLTYEPAPEGAVAPNKYFYMKDTVDVAEPLEFKVAFQNISKAFFSDSILVKAVVTDKDNVTHVLPLWKQRSLSHQADTLHISFPVDTRQLAGSNSLYIEVNPDNDQPEQYHFNNFFYKPFYVRPDTLNPLMDVTFDNVHILNNDIVSARPDILIKLKDESKWYLLNDTATVSLQVRFPDNSIRNYNFDGTTLTYIAPQQAPSTDNTATINLKPSFEQDGEYELQITGRDMSKNKTGKLQYRVTFQVYNKSMISNMLNYPNPFTSSTAFVFMLTGSEVPQNLKIQILTVTGKVIREITKDELGPVHIGRNITEFKWDGTDQYGQKLGNGVYLYRVVTNLNGKSLDKFDTETDKYFNKGYGKMYLMR